MAKTITTLTLTFCLLTVSLTLEARSPFPLETLYAHTDKQNYFTDENIWFRAYLLCSQTHMQTVSSRYIYAELINLQREVVNRVKIRHDENGVFAGHIPVTENLEAGVYNLRFFTRHLENFGEEYFFQRAIRIITPQSLEEGYLSEQFGESYLPENVPTLDPNESFAISFHPEGGDIPIGIETLIAFNAINSTGLGEHIKGVVVNERGDTITRIESAHLGMGAFELLVYNDEQLFAVVQNASGMEKRVELPRAKENAISLQIFRYEGNIIVYLPQSKTNNRILYLSLQRKGISHSERWDNESEIFVISEDELPTGIIGFVLSDAQGIPLSKRQIFNINRTETVNTTFTTESETHQTRERVNATVTITDSEGFPLNANFSISVIDNDIAHYDASVNILSTLLLTSELRGHIENPAYYFMAENENAKEHLDLVMLTHGWTRFDANRVYKEATAAVWQDFERSQTITGTLRGSLLRGRGNQLVRLFVPQFGFIVQPFDAVYTDSEGRFRFENFQFPEDTWFRLQSERRTEIQVDDVAFPAVTDFFVPTTIRALGNEQIEVPHRFMHDYAWSLELDEFIVTARRQERFYIRSINREFIDAIQITLTLRRLLEDILNLRGDNLVVLDGLYWTESFDEPEDRERDRATFDEIFIDMRHIISIEIQEYFNMPPRPMIPCRITGGIITGELYDAVVRIRTDRRLTDRNFSVMSPLGYQIRQEFFSPAYTTPEQRANERPDFRTTVYWNPSVITEENGKVEIYFYTSDNTGNYVVVIEGVTDEGRIVHMMGRIR